MRMWVAALPLTILAACSGEGPQTVGGTAVPPPGTGGPINGGNGSGVTSGTNPGTGSASGTFLDITGEKTFDAVGSFHSLAEDSTTGGVSYAGNASIVRTPTGQITYSPRDGIFSVTFKDTKAAVNDVIRFQDPAHRTDFAPYRTPQWGVPDLNGFNYLEAVGNSVDDVSTFFYQRPGTSTTYVSLAGFVRNNFTDPAKPIFERGAMVFGSPSSREDIPTSGTGTYTGGFLATMIANPTLDDAAPKANNFQWMQGDSSISVNFGKGTVGLTLNGTVNQANMSGYQIPDAQLTIPTGATFTASGSGTIDMMRTGGFTGQFQSAEFNSAAKGTQKVDFAAISPNSNTAGASSIDGTFYGPGAVNVGGNFRIVGGIPNQRVDILGAFTGAKQN